MEADLNEKKNPQESEFQKYEVLYKKDKEMTDFMENFDKLKEDEIKQVKQLEETIVKILIHASDNIKRQEILPTKDTVEDMGKELA